MRKTILIFSFVILLIFSIAIAHSLRSSDVLSTRKPTSNTVRLIVNTSSSESKQQFVEKGCKIIREMEEETAIECPKSAAKNLPNAVEDRIFKISDEDALPKGAIPNNINPQDIADLKYLGVPNLWEKGITGKERVVAILDTGIDYTHPSLANDILASVSFVSYTNDPMDDIGHGTHVAGIITSDGNPEFVVCFNEIEDWWMKVSCSEPHDNEITIEENAFKGIAPDAKIIMGKVCGSYGCYESDLMAGLDWASKGVLVEKQMSCFDKCRYTKSCCQRTTGCSYEQIQPSNRWACVGNYIKTETVKPDVISLSLGGGPLYLFSNCDKDPLAKKINKIVKEGIPVVVAAGNGIWGVSIPACASEVIAGGAAGCTDWYCEDWYRTIAYFSGRGFPMKDHGVMAPGVAVFSTVPTGGCRFCDTSGFTYLSGTSMSSPYVAGMIALIKQQHPTFSPQSIKNRLFGTATDMLDGFIFPEDNYKNYEQGYGLISSNAV